MKTARTGLKMEARLYAAAQREAGRRDISFAAYVTDLIAADLASHSREEVIDIPAVRRVLGLRTATDKVPAIKHLQKMESDEARQLVAKLPRAEVSPSRAASA